MKTREKGLKRGGLAERNPDNGNAIDDCSGNSVIWKKIFKMW